MTNKPKVKRYDDMGCPEQICRVDTIQESDDGDFVLYEDYEALAAECSALVDALTMARETIAYALHENASEYFATDADIARYVVIQRIDAVLSAHRKGAQP